MRDEIFIRNCSNMPRIGAKLCENAFQTILDVSFFNAEKFVRQKCFIVCLVGMDFGELRPNRCHSEPPRQILLWIDLWKGLRVQNISDSMDSRISSIAGVHFPYGITSTASNPENSGHVFGCVKLSVASVDRAKSTHAKTFNKVI